MYPERVLQKLQLIITYKETTSTQFPDIVPDEENRQSNTDTAELLRLHHKFGHFSFWKIIKMSTMGDPRKIRQIKHPSVISMHVRQGKS